MVIFQVVGLVELGLVWVGALFLSFLRTKGRGGKSLSPREKAQGKRDLPFGNPWKVGKQQVRSCDAFRSRENIWSRE